MEQSIFTLVDTYTPDHDLLVLPFLDEQTPCFETNGLPFALADAAPTKKGAARTVYAGALEDSFVLAQAVRLDDDTLPAMENMKMAVVNAIAIAKKEKLQRVAVFLTAEHEDLILAAQEGAELGGYAFDKYLQEKASPISVCVVSTAPPSAPLAEALKDARETLACVSMARDVLNEPPNAVNPPTLAEVFEDFGAKSGLAVETWKEDRLEAEGCGGIVSVGKGSSAKPRLVLGEYSSPTPKLHLALVGKGVTFDTGGYSLKPSEFQVGMKYDMGGAAMIFAAACAIARLKLPVKLTVLTPLVENNVSSNAYKVSDILTTRNGKTVEVLNTDAEGRLILADALALACEHEPDIVIDAATLTGACVVGLGDDIAAVYSTDQDLSASMLSASEATGEAFWPMPLFKPYAEKLKSTVADVNNTGKTRYGGSITAALFLQNWVTDNVKWMHLDIAGPGGKEEALGPIGKGGKGFGVRSLVELVKRLTSE